MGGRGAGFYPAGRSAGRIKKGPLPEGTFRMYGGGTVTLDQLKNADTQFKLEFYGMNSLDDIWNQYGFYSRGDQEKLLDSMYEDDVMVWINDIEHNERYRKAGAGAYDPNLKKRSLKALQRILLKKPG